MDTVQTHWPCCSSAASDCALGVVKHVVEDSMHVKRNIRQVQPAQLPLEEYCMLEIEGAMDQFTPEPVDQVQERGSYMVQS